MDFDSATRRCPIAGADVDVPLPKLRNAALLETEGGIPVIVAAFPNKRSKLVDIVLNVSNVSAETTADTIAIQKFALCLVVLSVTGWATHKRVLQEPLEFGNVGVF